VAAVRLVLKLHGALERVPRDVPLAKNSTLTVSFASPELTEAWKVTVAGAFQRVLSCGMTRETVGGTLVFETVKVRAAEVVCAPWLSVATADGLVVAI